MGAHDGGPIGIQSVRTSMSTSPDADELERRLEALEAAIEEVQTELTDRPGPLGLPRPPSPRQLLRATDEIAIPSMILALETTIKALEISQRAIRMADRSTRGTPDDSPGATPSGLRRELIDQLDRTIEEVRGLVENGAPREPEAREILADARAIRDEISEYLNGMDGDRTPLENEFSSTNTDRVPIDVDAELASIKDELDTDTNTDSDELS